MPRRKKKRASLDGQRNAGAADSDEESADACREPRPPLAEGRVSCVCRRCNGKRVAVSTGYKHKSRDRKALSDLLSKDVNLDDEVLDDFKYLSSYARMIEEHRLRAKMQNADKTGDVHAQIDKSDQQTPTEALQTPTMNKNRDNEKIKPALPENIPKTSSQVTADASGMSVLEMQKKALQLLGVNDLETMYELFWKSLVSLGKYDVTPNAVLREIVEWGIENQKL